MQSLSLQDHTLDAIPHLDATLAGARALMDDLASWHEGKSHGNIKTFRKRSTEPGPDWHARISTHPPNQGSFDEFWTCLGIDHSLHEKEYIPEIHSAVHLRTFGSFQAWSLGYRFSPPVSNRTFTFLIASVLEESPTRQGYIITLPLDVSSDEELKSREPKGVRGRYVSVERLRQLDGEVEWSMATMSNAGGMIPVFLSESQMPSKISQDVPHVLDWIKKKREL
ncbi:hypothetical protein RhiJN_00269 [Ceratobasidium sp. AG-Ba]|nr:hypothetical protein RhiJN_00269 [Ceratobasidium sp. AG-Ba]